MYHYRHAAVLANAARCFGRTVVEYSCIGSTIMPQPHSKSAPAPSVLVHVCGTQAVVYVLDEETGDWFEYHAATGATRWVEDSGEED